MFDDIRQPRQTGFISNFWLCWAFGPALVEETRFGVNLLTAAARAKGMTDELCADHIRVVATAGRTNQLLNGLQGPVGQAFEADG